MGKEFGQDLWKVEGIPGVGSDNIKGIRPQGLTFNPSLDYNNVTGAPVLDVAFGLAAGANFFILPYNCLLEHVACNAYVTDGASSYEVVDPRSIEVELLAGGNLSLNTFVVDSLPQYLSAGGALGAGVGQGTTVRVNGNENWIDLKPMAFICRQLQVYVNIVHTVPVAGTMHADLYLRFKRA